MRILLANTRHYVHGGDSSYTFALSEALRAAGHTVSFFAMAGPRNLPDPNSDLFVSYIDFRELNQRRNLRSGVEVLRRSIFSSEAAAKFTRLVERCKPDVVHLQNIHAHLTPSIVLAAERLGLPVVWTMHDYKVLCPNSHFRIDATGVLCEACRPGRYHAALTARCKKNSLLASAMAAAEAYAHWLRGVQQKVHCYLSPSRFLAGKLLEHGWPSERVRHVPNFVASAAVPERSHSGTHFLFVGKLEPLKGIDVLLEAAAAAPDSRILLAGGCDDAGVKAKLSRLPANVSYLGVRSAYEIARLMAEARAVIVPSIWYENQPMVILEAFSAGAPVIGSRIGGIPELVADRERGLLVPPGDAQELAHAITTLQRDAGAAMSMGRAARSYVLANHTAAGHLTSVQGIYERAIHDARPAGRAH